MLLLVIFAFLGGIVTILSPCILPILPIILSSSVGGSRKRSFGIILGFISGFTFFTLFLNVIVRLTGISTDALRNFSVIVILIFGLTMVVPKLTSIFERLFSFFSRFSPKTSGNEGFAGGIIIGLSIGLIWTPCVGPILASVISLALSGNVTTGAIFITLAYALGTSLPMFAVLYGGRSVFGRFPRLARNTQKIQRIFGILMIFTALAINFNLDRKFQSYILDIFPQYGLGLTQFEDNESVRNQLDRLTEPGGKTEQIEMGKPMFESGNINAPELIAGGEWFNTPAEGLTLSELRGKVVMVDFWTYTCINCIRTLPYLRNWHEKYADKGLVIIGVHTPEFEFEKSPENVKKAIADFDLKYPIMQDNDFATWRVYDNHYWPAKYIVDAKGKIRYTHFGEGEYDETEKVIQELLEKAGESAKFDINNPQYKIETKTSELYLGYGRMGYFATPDQLEPEKKKTYTLPENLVLHHFALSGEWKIEEERSTPDSGSTLVLAYEAKDVFLVMRAKGSESGKVRVYLDDKLLGQDPAGEDVKEGVVTIDKDRLYKLVQAKKAGQHILKLEFLDSNIELYAFTFG